MSNPIPNKLYDSELKIMEVLWKNGDTKAKQIADILLKEVGWNINTTYTLITVISVGLCRLLPKKIAFAVRIGLYALIASVVYIAVTLLMGLIFGEDTVRSISLYLAIIVTNPFIMTKTESRFFLRPVHMMFKDLAGFAIGFDLSCILVGAIRDILSDNMLWNTIIPLPFQMSAMENVYGGFILVGVLAGLFRFVYRKYLGRKARLDTNREDYSRKITY